MGSVCSRSKTKSAKPDEEGLASANVKTKNPRSPIKPAADAAANVNSTPHNFAPVVDSQPSNGNISLPHPDSLENNAGSAPFSATAPSPSMGNRSDHPRNINGSVSGMINPPDTLDSACPSPSQKGRGSDAYFPSGHDTGMKLGAAKYMNIGVGLSPDRESSVLQSLESSTLRENNRGSEGRWASLYNTPPPPDATRIVFTDDDTSVAVTASSAFATPREIHAFSGTVPGSPLKASIASQGSMESQRPHGYSYYNSSAIDAGYLSLRSPASRRASVATASVSSTAALPKGRQIRSFPPRPQPFLRSISATTTITDVRTNLQVPLAASVGGASSPLTRLSSIAGSDRFQSCRSFTDTSFSAIGHVTPATPSTMITGVNARGLSSISPESTTNGAPPTEQQFHTCRSAYTTTTDALWTSSPTTLAADSAREKMAAGNHSEVGAASEWSAALLRSPNAQVLSRHEDEGRHTGYANAHRSDLFFSLVSKSSDFFPDPHFTSASTFGDYTHLDGRIHSAVAAANTSHQSKASAATTTATSGGGPARRSKKEERSTVASPAVRPWRSVGAAAATSPAWSFAESLNSRSALASRKGSLVRSTKKLPRERQAAPGTSAVLGRQATNKANKNRVSNAGGTETPVRTLHNVQSGFSAHLSSPPLANRAMAGAPAAAAHSASSLSLSSSSACAAAASTTPAPYVYPKTNTVTEVQSADSAFVSSSTQSDVEGRSYNAARGGPVADFEGRTTQAYVEASPHLSSPVARAVTGGGDTAAPPFAHSASAPASTAALSNRHGCLVPASLHDSSKPQKKPQLPKSNTTNLKRRLSSMSAGGTIREVRSSPSAPLRGASANGKKAYPLPAARATLAARTAGATTAAQADMKKNVHPRATAVIPASKLSGTSCSPPLTRLNWRSKQNGGHLRSWTTPGRTGASTMPASAKTSSVAAATRRMSGGAANLGLGGEARQRTTVSRSVSRPWAASVRKPPANRAAAAAAPATPTRRTSLKTSPSAPLVLISGEVESPERETPDSPRVQSIIECAPSMDPSGGENEATGTGTLDADSIGGDRGLRTAPVAAPPQQPLLQGCGSPMEGDVFCLDGVHTDFPVQERSSQSFESDAQDASQLHLCGLQASPSVSDVSVTRSMEGRAFSQSCAGAQLASQLNGATTSVSDEDSDGQRLKISEGDDNEEGVEDRCASSDDDRAASVIEVERGCVVR